MNKEAFHALLKSKRWEVCADDEDCCASYKDLRELIEAEIDNHPRMKCSHTFTRQLMNLELSKKQIMLEYLDHEKKEIKIVNKEKFEFGCLGEFGIRKAITSAKVIQNFPSISGDFWYDWCLPNLPGYAGESIYAEVKSQRWWEPSHMELVLQDNNTGRATNFQAHYKKIEFLLVWGMKLDNDTITPLALVDPRGVMKEGQLLNKGGGISASVRTLHEMGYLRPLNDEWRDRLLSI